MMREYIGKSVNADRLLSAIEEFFTEEHFVTQKASHKMGHILQARKGGILRTVLGSTNALTMVLEGEPSDFRIYLGVSKWIKDLNSSSVPPFYASFASSFKDVSETVWPYEFEHHLWHFIESQMELGFQ